jgi:hypothetical protein
MLTAWSVRLGDLDPSRLRHPEARAMIPFA